MSSKTLPLFAAATLIAGLAGTADAATIVGAGNVGAGSTATIEGTLLAIDPPEDSANNSEFSTTNLTGTAGSSGSGGDRYWEPNGTTWKTGEKATNVGFTTAGGTATYTFTLNVGDTVHGVYWRYRSQGNQVTDLAVSNNYGGSTTVNQQTAESGDLLLNWTDGGVNTSDDLAFDTLWSGLDIVLTGTTFTVTMDSTGSTGVPTNANRKGFRADALVIDYTAVPEPGSLALLGLGGLCMLKRRRRG